MNSEKLNFLRSGFIQQLRALSPDTAPVFGKMNLQQMIEHMIDSVQIANGKVKHAILTPEERLKPMKDFLMSEKDFRPNTPNSLMSDIPAPTRLSSVEGAIAELEIELADFINHFEAKPGARTINPFFGDLNYEEWVQMLHKHALHHLRQFGVAV